MVKQNLTGWGQFQKERLNPTEPPPNSIFTQGNFFKNKEMYE
uniref:Uncharacterized protein n=1 Tax=Siphoviridae sp. ctNmW2 TaxID=2826306 RepID=A0A8S5MIL0_9CAUD|nr:MAG TPA: hypothetical protein [Siphoviridae sp. ctNmW2]